MVAEGTVLISGSQWLGGKGEAVYSNGGNYLTRYQCVELPQMRLYPKKGWPKVYAAGNGGATYIPEGSPGLTRYNKGSKYIPVPGDLVIENATTNNAYGHVSVLDYTDVSKGIIYAVEQNASSNGRVTYSYNGSNYSGLSASRSVKCILHAPGNTFKNPSTEKNVGALDSFNIKAREITVSGWHATSNSSSGPNRFIFLMDASTGKELCRQKINKVTRNDVAKVHPSIPGSGMSGFSTSIPVTDKLLGKTIKVMSRYAKETGGNGSVSDYTFSTAKKTLDRMNGGSLDSVKVNPTSVRLGGWHLSNYGDINTFRYAILIDQSTGKEIKRKTFMSGNRPDVAKAYPNQPFALQSGFDVTIDTTGIKGKKVKAILRYAKNAAGEGIIDDIHFNKVFTL